MRRARLLPMGRYLRDAYPGQAGLFEEQAASRGFCATEIGRMCSWLAKICVATGTSPEGLTATQYPQVRAAVHDAVIARRRYRPRTLSTPLFGLDAAGDLYGAHGRGCLGGVRGARGEVGQALPGHPQAVAGGAG
ncbi:hypothetical protein [Janibacter sp. G1551]|uniref:hypothetical protein n=1 Tax=Janibacter sp. G1551 TaxID=3420440 RepID=UPI003D0515BA